ncbi:hypothetical protein [Candidatus Accumulibacter sp. ACC007]|uniref:WD40/YVTN/BNR-like repeat-containing protein n=1 Tax=Candidatus Accumulibacter sp. ACC007 TaxID=2823333 RepID=UPI0025C663C0|nr:hypothetical protein [Candidatus Accumulibacter sp. ACC007]
MAFGGEHMLGATSASRGGADRFYGHEWQLQAVGVELGSITAMAATADGAILYAANADNVLWRSEDAGKQWVAFDDRIAALAGQGELIRTITLSADGELDSVCLIGPQSAAFLAWSREDLQSALYGMIGVERQARADLAEARRGLKTTLLSAKAALADAREMAAARLKAAQTALDTLQKRYDTDQTALKASIEVVKTNAIEHEKSALAIAANIAALAQKEAVEQQRVVAAAAQTRALAEQKQTLEAAHEQAVDTLAANAALAAAQTHAESFAGMLEQANADWAAHPNGEQQRGAVIALRKQKAYADAHHQIAGNLSRMLLSGTRVETPGNPHDPHNPGDVLSLYEATGQQFPLVGSKTAVAVTLRLRDGAPTAEFAVPPGMLYDRVDNDTLHWETRLSGSDKAPGWVFRQLPPIMRRQKRLPLSHLLAWSDKARVLAPFSDELRLTLATGKDGTLALIVKDTEVDDTRSQTTHDHSSGDWANARPALVIPVGLHRVDRIGTDGKKASLKDVVEIEGTDEAGCALLELLLTAASVGEDSPIARFGEHKDFSTLGPKDLLLVKTNLSTASGGATTGEPSVPPKAPYFAPITRMADFLRLIWEASVVHVGGFLLKLSPADIESVFADRKKVTIKLVVIGGDPASACLPVEGFHNALVGDAPKGQLPASAAFAGERDIRVLMPTARRSVTPVAAEQHGEDDGGKPQMTLRVFARDFEKAYAGFDVSRPS